MNPTVERIINQCNSKERFECVEKLDIEIDLYSLMENYNWDDGFEIPYTVVTHKKCDLGLALMLFWEFDEPQLYYENPKSEWLYSRYEKESEIKFKIEFCEQLINGIRNGNFKKGANEYDTGFFGEHLYFGDERKTKIRKLKTKKALEKYEEIFLKPCLVEK